MLMAKHDVILLIHSLACKHSTGHMIILEAAFHVTLQRGATLSTEAAECALAGTAEGSIKSHELAAIILIDLQGRQEKIVEGMIRPLEFDAAPCVQLALGAAGCSEVVDPNTCGVSSTGPNGEVRLNWLIGLC